MISTAKLRDSSVVRIGWRSRSRDSGRSARLAKITMLVTDNARRCCPAPASNPIAAAHHKVAAVFRPRTLKPSRKMMLAPRKPIPILCSEGVIKGRISLQRLVALTSTNPARLYGLYPQKGSIAIGADADLTLWDPTLTRPIRQADLAHACDYTPCEGMEITGWPIRTVLRGRTIALHGRGGGEASGRELSRAISDVYT